MSIVSVSRPWDSLYTVTSFDTSIIGDEFNSAVQLPNFRSVVLWHAACIHDSRCVHKDISMRLRQPRECMNRSSVSGTYQRK